MIDQIAIYAPASGLAIPKDAFGKDVANLGLYRALAQHGGFKELALLTAEAIDSQELQNALLPNGGGTKLRTSDLLDLYSPCLSGVLLRGQPYLDELAWIRSAFRSTSAYSLVGLIHTLAPPAIREDIGKVAISPLETWDALICTSPSVKKAVEKMLDGWVGFLRQRFDARKITLPELPLIPLGVDFKTQDIFSNDQQARRDLRNYLGLVDEDVLVLWIGRLSFYEKAFPQSMFIALEQAAKKTRTNIHFVMVGWFPGGKQDEKLYFEASSHYCPSVNVHFLDGRNQALVKSSWAASDIFLSLVDNPQETFGLSPVEAMAAGLPVVVSDWDGYRYTVRDGIDGFLISTLIGPDGGIGDELAARHSLGLLSYQDYVGSVSQHVAVDPEQAGLALARLAENPDLRLRMGDSGKKNVKERFDWPVIAGMYHELFVELSNRRSHELKQHPRLMHPLRGNPFADFSDFATDQMDLNLCLALSVKCEDAIITIDSPLILDNFYHGCHADKEELKALITRLSSYEVCSLKDLLIHFDEDRYQHLLMGITWLAKLGLIQWKSII